MTTNHPDPTPPPAEPAPSLRPVEELQALCDAATCGPWFVVGQPWNSGPPYVISEHPDPHYGVFVADFDPVDWTNDNATADAAFIAAARTALPALLARLRAAEETLAAVGALHQRHAFVGRSDHHHAASLAVVGAIAAGFHVCTEECFETFMICDHDGLKWPCPTAAALAEGASR